MKLQVGMSEGLGAGRENSAVGSEWLLVGGVSNSLAVLRLLTGS